MKRLVTTLWLVLGLLLMLAIGNAGLAVWSARQADRAIERLSLAHDVYQKYLQLESTSYQLFKQYGNAATIGDRDQGAGEGELKATIFRITAEIRRTIGSEIKLVGDEEIEELEMLTAIERRLASVIAALERQESKSYAEVVTLLDNVIDIEFRDMINRALAEETGEVVETRSEVLSALALDRKIAYASALFSVFAAFGIAWLVHFRIARPTRRLVMGAERFAEGDFGHRIDLSRQDEFGAIATTLDTMAGRVSRRAAEMDARNETLDSKLADRNAQLEALLEQASLTEEKRRRLLGDVSHELRTPLTIIRGEADVTLRGEVDRSAQEYRDALLRVREAADHSARIVDDLLTIARSESGELRLKVEKFDLRALAQSAADTFAGGLTVSGEEGPVELRADPGRIRQALLVLMDNARNHGGRIVDLRINRSSRGWCIDVADDGRGLSDAEKEQAFERFFRGSNAAEDYADGLGLGLPVARTIARAHGGDITLLDREGGGLSARLEIPSQPSLRAAS